MHNWLRTSMFRAALVLLCLIGVSEAVTMIQNGGGGAPIAGTGISVSGQTVTNTGVLSVTGSSGVTSSGGQNPNMTIGGGAILNTMLANAATTVNGTTCTLGSTCTVTASAGALTSAILKLTSGSLTRTTGTFADVTGATVTMTTNGATQALVSFFANVGIAGVNGFCFVQLMVDGTAQNGTAGIEVDTVLSGVPTNLNFSLLTPVLSNAAHTFKLQFKGDGGNVCTIAATTATPLNLFAKEVY